MLVCLQYIESWIVGGDVEEKEGMPVICFLCRPSGYMGKYCLHPHFLRNSGNKPKDMCTET